MLDERTYSILCRRLQLELNITDEVLGASQESKGIFMRLDEENEKLICIDYFFGKMIAGF